MDTKVDDNPGELAKDEKKIDDDLKGPRKLDRPDAYTHRKTWARNNRSDYSKLKESNDAADCRKQVEFYFSDSNLPTDKYLLELTGGHENKPVDLKIIHDFKRMRHFQPYSVVHDAVKTSKVLDLTDGHITRKVPLDAKFTKDVSANADLMYSASVVRSIYAKGFGEEYDTMQLDIENFFKPYGPFNSVRMRRSFDGNFKGSVFVEFANEDLAKQFLAQDPKPVWVSGRKEDVVEKESTEKKDVAGKKDDVEKDEVAEKNDDAEKEASVEKDDAVKDNAAEKDDAKENKGLLIMSKIEYIEGKNENIKNGTMRPSSPRRSGRGGGRGGRGARGGRGGRGGRNDRDRHDRREHSRRDRDVDRDDWKERRNRDQNRGHKKSRNSEDGDSKKRDRDDTHAADDAKVKKQEGEQKAAVESDVNTKKRGRDDTDAAGADAKKQKAGDDVAQA